MYVQITRKHEDGRPKTTRLKDPGYDALNFHPQTGTAQCTKETGEYYLDAYPGVVVESGSGDESDTETDADSDSDSDDDVETDGGREPEFFAAIPDDEDEDEDEDDADVDTDGTDQTETDN